VPGVGRVDVQGSDVRELEVIADPARLAAQGMTYADLADAIRRAITVQAVGRVAQDYRQYLIVTDQEAHAPADIGAVVIRGGLRVSDVATVQLGTEGHGRIIAISAASIPLTLAITVFIMSMVGQTFNLMTLGAMAIAIGLVIDDAVVITENIARHLRLTPDRMQAIRAAVQELIWPVTT